MKEESNVFGSLAAVIEKCSYRKKIIPYEKKRLRPALDDPRGK
jgi:hypothetical protein